MTSLDKSVEERLRISLHAQAGSGVKSYVKVRFLVCWLAAAALWAQTAASPIAASPAAARDLFLDAKRAEKKGDLFRAYSLYTQASALAPGNAEYAGKSIGLRSKAMELKG